MVATIQATTLVNVRLANLPILRLSLVKTIKGITAKLNRIDRITWLNTNKLATPFSPETSVTINAGIIAIKRVISRLNHGFNLICKKPSMTICPASVPVNVEF